VVGVEGASSSLVVKMAAKLKGRVVVCLFCIGFDCLILGPASTPRLPYQIEGAWEKAVGMFCIWPLGIDPLCC
jgi:hypothetical protein